MRQSCWLPGVFIALAGVAAGSANAADGFRCQGNEPFWHLALDATSGVLTRPGADRPEKIILQGRLQALDYLRPPWTVWRGDRAGEPAVAVVAVIREESCRDTMADETPPFTHRAVITLPDGRAATGCCRTAPR